MLHDLDPATRYASRAKQLRTFIEGITDQKLRDDVERWAREYDRMVLMAMETNRPPYPDPNSN